MAPNATDGTDVTDAPGAASSRRVFDRKLHVAEVVTGN
jgi:hypothetical protein